MSVGGRLPPNTQRPSARANQTVLCISAKISVSEPLQLPTKTDSLLRDHRHVAAPWKPTHGDGCMVTDVGDIGDGAARFAILAKTIDYSTVDYSL